MNQIVKQDDAPVALIESESAQIIGMIGRLASDPDSDIDKMERLMAMRDKMLDRDAERAFNEALARVNAELPVIKKRGKGRNSDYALWEDVNEVVKPVLAKNGFSLSFKPDFSKANFVIVNAILRHSGYTETSSFESPIESPKNSNGNNVMNGAQSRGAAMSYGKRYAAGGLINITVVGEDDDAYSTSEADFDTSPFTDAIRLAETMDAMNKVASDMKAQDIPSGALTMLRTAWAGRAAQIQKGIKDAA